MTRVYLTCQSCGRRWLAILWQQGDFESAEKAAARVVCRCGASSQQHAAEFVDDQQPQQALDFAE